MAWFFRGLALQFALISMGSAFRGTGIVKPTIFVATVALQAGVSWLFLRRELRRFDRRLLRDA